MAFAQAGTIRTRATLRHDTVVLFYCFWIVGATSYADSASSAPANTAAAQAANLTACPNVRIAVINGVPYHYEVLAGLLYVLNPYASRTDVYLNQYTRGGSADGAWDLIRWSKANFQLVTRGLLSLLAKKRPQYDLVILVSTDYELDGVAELLRHIPRRLTVPYVHNSDFNETQRLLAVAAGRASGGAGGFGGADGIASDVQLVTLSPHTARSLAAVTGRVVEWVLAAYPFAPQPDCLAVSEGELLGRCLRGFSMQGKFSSLRRNYSSIWQQLQARQVELTSGDAGRLFHMQLLGKGDATRLGLPPGLQPHVSLLRRLRFPAFYNAIHRTFALVPALGSAKYYTDKFSSTILSSLISGTPVIADARFLASYGMFDERSVYFQGEGEQEVDVMLRVLHMRASELLGVRRALLALRRELNARAAAFYAAALTRLCSSDEA